MMLNFNQYILGRLNQFAHVGYNIFTIRLTNNSVLHQQHFAFENKTKSKYMFI